MKDFLRRSFFKVRLLAVILPAVVIVSTLLLMQGQSQAAVSRGLVAVPNMITAASQNELGAIQAGFVTTITVNTTQDITAEDEAENNENKHTCGFTQGAFFFPANGSSAGLCTLRRAILEASARPQSDRPILIEFNIPANDPNADLEEVGTWTIFLDQQLPDMETDSILNLNGQVTIDGETQPGIRQVEDGPGIIINAGDTGLQIYSTNNVIRNLAWKNVSEIAARNKANNNLFENLWMGLADDGNSIYFRDTNDYSRMAIGALTLASDGNTVRNSTITGAFAKAINIDGGDNNIVTMNNIGTLADGLVPTVPEASLCASSFSFDPANHYGGWGISLSGSNNQISRNRIAGLHILKSANDTAPPAIEIFGANHQIIQNVIGVDSKDEFVGVCGHGIKFSGSGHEISQNAIVRSRTSFEDSDETAILASDTSPLFGQVTVLENVVIDGPGDILEFANGISTDLRFFKPARITNISPAGVLTGQAEDGYPCGNCDIDFYLDDLDEIQEAFVHIGTVKADVDGKFPFDMGQPLPADRGIRTMATTNDANVIGSFGAGTTSEASQLYTPITDLTFSGPITGFTGVQYQIDFQVWPEAVTLPITYSVTATDFPTPLVEAIDNRLANVKYIWTTPGTKTIEVTADNGLSQMTKTTQIEIEQADIVGDMTEIVINGPTSGDPGVEYTFDITVNPSDVQTPIDYTLEVTDVANPFGGEFGRFTQYKKAWTTGGTKTIKVTADNGINSLSQTFQIVISEPDPTPSTPTPTSTPGSTPSTPEPTSTPAPTSTPSSPSSSDKFIYLPLVVR